VTGRAAAPDRKDIDIVKTHGLADHKKSAEQPVFSSVFMIGLSRLFEAVALSRRIRRDGS